MRDIIDLVESKLNSQDKVEIVKLAHSISQFAPVLSSSMMKLHYEKLAHGYADRFNNRQGDSVFNYAGAWLHNVYFQQFRPARMNNVPNGPIGNLIKTKFKSFDGFKDAIETEAMKLHGSGWIYLSRDGSIKIINNHQVRNDILILIDLWEHAYQHDYGSNKQKYLDNIWRIMDWNVLNTRWGQGYK